ncbi:MAG: formylglycine-generating enzyme family protein [Gammaproteobacteria bacterium]|nr:formylglycine-generating enzyme family protein [Gammaproteobacteria bacterium]
MKTLFPFLFLCLMISACSKNTTNEEQAPLTAKSEKAKQVVQGSHANIAMVKVPAGEFIRGSDKEDKEGLQQRYGFPDPLFLDEHPQHTMHLKDFYIDQYEVSLKQYKEFVSATEHKKPMYWFQNGYALTMEEAATMEEGLFRKIAAEHFKLDMDTTKMSRAAIIEEMKKKQAELDVYPATGVSWHDADAYCKWRGQRLPTEAEWEKAARGPNGNEFPWGNQWDTEKTETGDDSEFDEGIAPIGAYPQNKSYYGAYDLGGNVWEWVDDWYQAYPGNNNQNEKFGTIHKVIRGGGGGVGHYAISYFFRGATRQYAEPEVLGEDVGFRCAKDI